MFFDLPVKTSAQRRSASRFRSFLLSDGSHVAPHAVHARLCNGVAAVHAHTARLRAHLPDSGAVRMLVVTEKQYGSIEILLGKLSAEEEDSSPEQPLVF